MLPDSLGMILDDLGKNDFVKHFLKRGTKYTGPLGEPKKNIVYFFDYMVAKIKFYIKNLLK